MPVAYNTTASTSTEGIVDTVDFTGHTDTALVTFAASRMATVP